MKKIIAFLLVMILCLSFWGCAQKDTVRIEKPVSFYYRRAEISYGSGDGVIAICISEGAGYEEDLLGLLNVYLRNSDDPAFVRTFPADSQLIKLKITDGVAEVQLNNLFARHTGIDLTIACACLSLTVMELTQVETVCISTTSATLDGAESITMTADSILLLDLYEPESEK